MIKSAIISGFAGIVIMSIFMASGTMAPSGWLFLWPSCIFGFGYNGHGGFEGFLVWTFEIVGQFLVYAGFGLGVGMLVQKFRKVA